jgi:Zn-dependent protease with chaperone function
MRMIEVTFYDGNLSRQLSATIAYSQDYFIHITCQDDTRQYLLQKTEISPRLGQLPHTLIFPDGASCEVNNHAFVDQLIADQQKPNNFNQWIHYLESKFSIALISALITVAIIWLGITNGLPWLSKQAAYALPATVNSQVGEETLALLDKYEFLPSKLDEATQLRLTNKFSQLKNRIDLSNKQQVQLKFRKSKTIGANAFAFPSGDIIITDQLIQLAKNDNEVLGVLAHEIGHINARHSLRQIIQTTGLTMIFGLALGDVSSITSFTALLPAMLVELKYSREFELEADDYAIRGLQQMGIHPHHYASLLERLSSHHAERCDNAYWSTHPLLPDRVERIRMVSKQ